MTYNLSHYITCITEGIVWLIRFKCVAYNSFACVILHCFVNVPNQKNPASATWWFWASTLNNLQPPQSIIVQI